MIGFGVYPNTKLEDIINFVSPGQYILVMGVDKDERHDIAQALKSKGCHVVRRRYLDDKFNPSPLCKQTLILHII